MLIPKSAAAKIKSFPALKMMCYLAEYHLADSFVYNEENVELVTHAYHISKQQIKVALSVLLKENLILKVKRGHYKINQQLINP